MAKKDIGKLIEKGTATQRALALIEDEANFRLFSERLLTPEERELVKRSFITSKDISTYKDLLEAHNRVSESLTYLQGLKFEALMNLESLRIYIMAWHTVENAELMVNTVLHSIKDKQERAKVAQFATIGADILLCKTLVDKEGYLEIDIDFPEIPSKGNKRPKGPRKDPSLLYLATKAKERAERSMIKFMSWGEAIEDYMSSVGLKTKAHKKHIKELSQAILSQVGGWGKFEGSIDEGYSNNPHMIEAIKKYNIKPNIDGLEVNREEYYSFRRSYLDMNYTKEVEN